jgi:hypothetical protein
LFVPMFAEPALCFGLLRLLLGFFKLKFGVEKAFIQPAPIRFGATIFHKIFSLTTSPA